ncbi:MAG: hypothetical protein LLG20_10175 [Acidobacteriales bacterium]|nr:hypothetical protein [Terriglobales bacterium]
MSSPLGGIALVLFAGIVGGSVLAPMKFVRGWKWEHTWLLYVFCAYFLSPWLMAFATVPHLGAVYVAGDWGVVLPTALFGFLWGCSLVFYGVAYDIVGLSLTSGIILGASVALGSLLPLTVLHTEQAKSANPLAIAAADTVMLAGVLLCAWAGDLREKVQSQAVSRPRDPRFRTGILICLAAGVVSTAFNMALVWGAPLARHAERLGADPFYAANAIWSISASVGSLPSLALTMIKIGRNNSWRGYLGGKAGRNISLCVFMGVMWICGTALYGSAAGILGPLGPVIGWPIYMSSMILASNFWGWLTGEWKHVSGRPVRLMFLGIGIQILAMVILGRLQ